MRMHDASDVDPFRYFGTAADEIEVGHYCPASVSSEGASGRVANPAVDTATTGEDPKYVFEAKVFYFGYSMHRR